MIWESISGFQEGDGAKLPKVAQILIPREMLANTESYVTARTKTRSWPVKAGSTLNPVESPVKWRGPADRVYHPSASLNRAAGVPNCLTTSIVGLLLALKRRS